MATDQAANSADQDTMINDGENRASTFLFIGELAKETGADPKTIRFYERADLLSPPRHGRFRTYLASDVKRLKDVLRLRKMGMPIAQIRTILQVVDTESDVLSSPRMGTMLTTHLQYLRARRQEIDQQLQQTEAALTTLTP